MRTEIRWALMASALFVILPMGTLRVTQAGYVSQDLLDIDRE